MIPISTTSKIVIARPAIGTSPNGFTRVHVEMLPREVGRLIGYDPRVLIMKPRTRTKDKTGKVARGTKDTIPHNVSIEIVTLQNSVQRSVDNNRVAQMVDYLLGAIERQQFADWGPIELVTISRPDFSDPSVVAVDADADYFIADGQHRYCALLDFLRLYPHYADRFTQALTISILPEEKLTEWAGQEFHDRNYFSQPVRAGKALSVDTRDPINALAKALAEHPAVQRSGGVAYERDTLLAGDTRFASHSTLHRFVRGFLFGRPGLDKGGVDTRSDVPLTARENLWEYLTALETILPWADAVNRDAYLTRTSVVMAALSVIGNALYYQNGEPQEEKVRRLGALHRLDWRRTNLDLVGVVGSEKKGQVQPASSRQAIDATIRYLRERLGLMGTDVGETES